MRLLIILSVFLFSCSKYTPQKAIADVNKADYTFPNAVKKWVDEKHPCFPEGSKPDSTAYLNAKRIADSIQSLYEQEKSKLPEIQYMTEKDSTGCIEECNERIKKLNKNLSIKDDYIGKLSKELERLRNSPIHDTVIDNRKLEVANVLLEETNTKNAELEQQKSKLKSDLVDMKESRNKHKWEKWITWLIIAAYAGLRVAKKVKPSSFLKWVI